MGYNTIEITKNINTPLETEEIPLKQKNNSEKIKIVLSTVLIATGLAIYLWAGIHRQSMDRRALACIIISAEASIFWSLHLFSLSTTSIALLPIIILSGILTPKDYSSGYAWKGLLEVFRLCFSKIFLLLIGSCMLSSYFRNNGGDRLILPYLAGGTDGQSTLFRCMLLSVVLSSVMSNITAPIIIISLLGALSVTPSKALVLGIALASNIGGMLLPISSPQSILGSFYMKIGWIEWLSFSLPTVIVCFVFLYLMIVVVFKDLGPLHIEFTPELQMTVTENKLNTLNIGLVTFASVLCWSIPSLVPGVDWICGIPIVFLALTKDSYRVLNAKTLEIMSIALVGTALGKSIERTAVLENAIHTLISHHKTYSLLSVIGMTSFIMLIISCLVCHTVSAVVFLPVLQRIGEIIHQEKLILGVATLACSCGMALPSSGFPNILASGFRDRQGARVIDAKTFILIGTISTLVCWVFILTVSVSFMTLIGL
ncbi:phosphate transporter [Nematocida sp. AWRm80]|nr:phosphate transporter [Nematocida sp. AWRm80]